jgi:ribosomal protein S18 acetylase RimI-like enzyme
MSEVISLQHGQFDEASQILANAFVADPLFNYLIPETEQARVKFCQWNFKNAFLYCQPYNHIYTTTGDIKGAAAWLPPGESNINIWRMLPVLLAMPFKLGLNKFGKIMSFFSVMEERRKHNMPQPHWYLMLLGVSSAYQSQGVGGLLLQPILEQADKEGHACYLETTTDRAIRFYQKHGFEIIRQEVFAEDAPPFWTMKREPFS